jgi:hypothetical protein
MRERQAAFPSGSRRQSLRWLLLLLAVGVVSTISVWMISPRFEIDTPSVVDDWASLFYSSDQMSKVVRFENPEIERFRPGVILWTYIQWHTFDAPGGLVGPNVWNVLRILILVAGLSLFTALALPVPRGQWEAALHAALATLPAFVVVLVPKFARDLARFGPQEPLVVGGMALGGALLVLAGKSLLSESRPVQRWRIAALAFFGSAAWILGVYQKETSLCVLPLIAGVLIAARSHFASWPRLSTSRKSALAAIGAVVALPLVHVAVETFRIVQRGDLVYDAEVSGGRGLASGVRELYNWAHEALPENARQLMWAAIALMVVAAFVRRRVDPIAVGALLSGALSFAFAGQSGVVATRYYIPICALFAVAFVLSLARLPTAIQVVGALAVVFAFIPPPGTRDEVQSWTNEELGNSALVKDVARVESSGCLVAAAGLDLESSLALPVLVGLKGGSAAGPCDADAYLVVGPGEDGRALASACAEDALEELRQAPIGSFQRCQRLRTERVRDATYGLVKPEMLVALRRLEPVRSQRRLDVKSERPLSRESGRL